MRRSMNPPRPVATRAAGFTLGLVASLGAHANPQGPDVVSGMVSFANPTANTLEITNSPAAIINWQSFDIGAGETTRFIQQSAASAVLNRVTTQNTSEILGNLVSNGRVFLINPAGIIIGRDGMVDTAGLVLSTLDISNEDFRAGRLRFEGGPESGAITNHGYIKSVPGGEIVLLAPKILNAPQAGNEKSGLIESENGDLVLAAGYSMTLTSLDDPDITFEVQAPTNEVVNLGQLLAKGGVASVLAGTIRHSGEINADSLAVDDTGRVVLTASHAIETTAESRISAAGGSTAPGGTVELRAVAALEADATEAPAPTTLTQAGAIDATGTTGGSVLIEADSTAVAGGIDASGTTAGGAVAVLGDTVAVNGSASVLANVATGSGGDIRIGGEYQGGEGLRAATTTTVAAGSRLEADAKEAGDAGTIVVWSDQLTDFRGSASARGGATGGDGGLIEVSGKETLGFAGSVEVSSPFGQAGTLLLDPRNIVIVPGASSASVADGTPFAGEQFGSSFSVVGDRIVVANQNADAPGLVDAGEITVLDHFGNIVGTLTGTATNERLGSFGFFTVSSTTRLYLSPNAPNGGLAQAGAVILFDLASGQEIGRTVGGSANEQFGLNVNSLGGNFVVRAPGADIGGAVDAGRVALVSGATGTKLGEVTGAAAGDQFGSIVDFFGVPSGRYLIRAPNADVGGLADNGTAVLVNAATGLEIGRTSGLASGDLLGSFAPLLRGSGNYFLQVPNATVGGNVAAGSLVLVSGTTGTRIGSVSGNGPSESFGSVVDTFFLGSNNVLVRSSAHDNGGLVDAGGVFVVADVDLGGGNILRGQTLGVSQNEFFGSHSPIFVNASRFAIISEFADTDGFTDNGSVVLIDSATGVATGRVNGQSTNEFLGSEGILTRSTGNYFVFSSGADTSGGFFVDAGAVILADGMTGNELGRYEGNTTGEAFGSDYDAFSLFNGDLLVYSPEHSDSRGLVAQLASAPIAPNVILRGGVTGSETDDLVGSEAAIFLPGGNYVIPVPTLANTPSVPNAGGVFVVNTTTAAGTLVVQGTTAEERLGDPDEIDTSILGFGNRFVVRSPDHGANNNGAIFFIDGASGTLLGQLDGATDDMLGSYDLILAPTGNLIVPVPDADVGGIFTDAGSVWLVNPFDFSVIGTAEGISTNERFGMPDFIDTFSLCCTDFLVHSPLRDVSGMADAGGVVIVSATTGLVQGAISGQADGDNLGEVPFAQLLSNGDYLLFNPSADSGILGDAGAVILVDALNFQERGRFYGQSANERLGDSEFAVEAANGNYFVASPLADPGGVVNAGSLYLGSAATGGLVGQANGDTANELFGTVVDYFSLFNGDVVVRSAGGHGGGGTVVQVASSDLGGGNIIRGRLDGTVGLGTAEALGDFAIQLSPNGTHYFIVSPNADGGGIEDSGSIYFVDVATGSQSGRIDGTSVDEFLGSSGAFFRPNGNLVIRSPQADVGGVANAGRLIVATGTGAVVGQFAGNHAGEQFGSILDLFTLPDSILVRAPLHDNGALTAAGGYFALADTDLGGGNILRWQVLGTSADEQLGTFAHLSLGGGRLLLRSPTADIGGLADAGELILVNGMSGAVIGRTQGISAGEQFGLFNPTFTAESNLLVASPLASPGGLTEAGRVVLVSGTTGTLIGATNGTSANERFGSFGSVSLVNNGIAYLSPDADVGGLVDAGAIVQIDPRTGLEITRIVGISANERLGAFGSQQLPNGTRVFSSPLADVGGVVDAGRLVFFNPVTGQTGVATDLVFSDSPSGDFVLTTGSIEAALASGATLVLQANNDIVFAPGTVINAPQGSLVLQAGRSVRFEAGSPGSLIIVRDLTIHANDAGADAGLRDSGNGDVFIDTSQLVGMGLVDVAGQTVEIVGGSDAPTVPLPPSSFDLFDRFLLDPAGFGLPASFVLGATSLRLTADNLRLGAGGADGAFAALVSFGEFTVDATHIDLLPGSGAGSHALILALGGLLELDFDTCVGCGDGLLLTDPFLDPLAQSGIYIAGLLENPGIDAILAMLGRDEAGDEEEEEESEEDVQQCN